MWFTRKYLYTGDNSILNQCLSRFRIKPHLPIIEQFLSPSIGDNHMNYLVLYKKFFNTHCINRYVMGYITACVSIYGACGKYLTRHISYNGMFYIPKYGIFRVIMQAMLYFIYWMGILLKWHWYRASVCVLLGSNVV